MEENPVQPSSIQDEQVSQKPIDTPPPEKPPRFTMKVKIIIAVVIVIIILLITGIAGAYWYSSSNQTPAIENESDKTSTLTPIPADPTADWSTYKNEEYGFTLKYPTEGEITEFPPDSPAPTIDIRFPPNTSSPVFILNILEISGEINTVNEYIENKLNVETDNQIYPTTFSRSKYNVSGVDGERLVSEDNSNTEWNNIEVITIFNNKIYHFDLRYNDSEDKEKMLLLADQILSTFKFTDSITDETADWKTYTSSIGFSIELPSDWKVNQFDENSFGDKNDLNTLEAFPENEANIPTKSISIGPLIYRDGNGKIYKTVSSLNEIKPFWVDQSYPSSWFVNTTTIPTKIDKFNAIIKTAVWKSTPPSDFGGEWNDKTEKQIFIDLNNGIFLVVSEKWLNSQPENEALFDQILSTIIFIE